MPYNPMRFRSTMAVAKKRKTVKTVSRAAIYRKKSDLELNAQDWNFDGTAYVDAVTPGYVSFYTQFTASAPTPPFCLTQIAAGDDINQRSGRQITLKSLHITGNVRPYDTSSQVGMCRLSIIYDKQTNGSVPALSDIFSLLNGYITSGAPKNLANRDRFEFLADIFIPMEGGGSTSTTNSMLVNRWVNLGNRKTTYNGTGSTVSNQNTGSLLVTFLGSFDWITASSVQSLFAGNMRLRFVD